MQPRHGLDAYCQEDDEAPIDYLRLMTAEPVEYKVISGGTSRARCPTPRARPRVLPRPHQQPWACGATRGAIAAEQPVFVPSKKYVGIRRDDRPAKVARPHADARAAGARVGLGPAVARSPGAALESAIDGRPPCAGHGRRLFSLRSGNQDLYAPRTRSAAIRRSRSTHRRRGIFGKLAQKHKTTTDLPPITKGDQPDYLPDPIHAELKERICDLRPTRTRWGPPAAGAADRFLDDIRGARRERRRPGRRRLQNHHHPGHLGKGLERSRRRPRVDEHRHCREPEAQPRRPRTIERPPPCT